MKGVLRISAKCSDLCWTEYTDKNGNTTESNGYVPQGIGIDEYGDYVCLDIDMATGQIQNWKPVSDEQVIKSQKMYNMSKEESIARIKEIIGKWGSTNTSKRECDHSPIIDSLGENVCALVENFNDSDVGVIVYHNEIEIDSYYTPYEDLDEEVINEILEIIEYYDVDMEKTQKRCEN